jgi:glycosyltransferase involved in cell wall biosynthesis
MTRRLPRVLFISRRFWPLLGGAETVVANLAAALTAQGGSATVLTALWDASWPAEIMHRSVRVVRLSQPSQRIWGTLHYLRNLAGWLRRHRDEFDLVYVSQLKHDAWLAVRSGRRGKFPVILRAAGGGLTGDCHWHTIGRCGMWIRRESYRAAAIVAPSPAICSELTTAGYRAEQVVHIANGVPAAPPQSAARQRQSRRVVAEANYALLLPEHAWLAVFTGRLDAVKGLADLVAAWQLVARQRGEARLWLVGEGPEHTRLVQQIEALGLTGRVVLAASFNPLDDVLQAADCFVLPSYEEGLSLALLEAMAAGLPIVASDIPGNRVAIRPNVDGLLVPPRDPTALAAAVDRVMTQPAWAETLGQAARQRVQEDFSLERMVQQHLELFDRVCSAPLR